MKRIAFVFACILYAIFGTFAWAGLYTGNTSMAVTYTLLGAAVGIVIVSAAWQYQLKRYPRRD